MANSNNPSANSSSFTVYTGLSIVTIILFLVLLGIQVAEFMFFNEIL